LIAKLKTIIIVKILLIEDEKGLSEAMFDFLKSQGHICEAAETFKQAEDKVSLYIYDVIIVDINLPGGSGLDIVSKLKKNNSESGIIIISARDSVEQKIEGLELGADDYLAKPFHLAELGARIKSLNRRVNFKGNNIIKIADLEIIPEEHRTFVKGQELELTKKEFDLLLFFVSNRNKVLTKIAISEHLWGDYMDYADSHDFIYTHIKNLRKKLTKKGCKDYLQTIYSVGYKFSPPETA